MALDDAVQRVSIVGDDDVITAFGNIGSAGAAAFTQIIEAASAGDFTGIAAKLTGDIGGAFAEIAKNVLEFTEATSAAIEKTEALSEAFGTTLEQTAGLKEAFAEAGVGANSLDRLMQRMSTNIAQGWSSIQQSIRESSSQAEGSLQRLEAAHLGVERAQEHLSEQGIHSAQQAVDNANSIQKAQLNLADAQAKLAPSPGGKVDKSLQDALTLQHLILAEREAEQAVIKANQKAVEDSIKADEAQKQAVLAVAQAHLHEQEAAEHDYDISLKSIPKIVDQLKELQQTGNQGNLLDVSIQHIVRGFQAMASVGGEIAKPKDVLNEVAKAFAATGESALTFQQKLDLVTRLGGGSMQRMGADAAKMVEVLSRGPEALAAFEAEAKKFALVLSDSDVTAAKATTVAFADLEIHFAALKDKLASAISPAIVAFLTNLDNIVKAVSVSMEDLGNKLAFVKQMWDAIPTGVRNIAAGAMSGALIGGAVGGPVGALSGGLVGAGAGAVAEPAEGAIANYAGENLKKQPSAGRLSGNQLADQVAAATQKAAADQQAKNTEDFKAAVDKLVDKVGGAPGKWSGGLILRSGGLAIPHFDTGGAANPFDNLGAVGSPSGGIKIAAADPKIYGMIGDVHKSIEEAGFDPTAQREMANNWLGGMIVPHFDSGGWVDTGFHNTGSEYDGVAKVGKTQAQFVLDTGAQAVNITEDTARAAGLNVGGGKTVSVTGVGGSIAAKEVLAPISAGGVTREVPTLVLPGFKQNLLGMTYWNALSDFAITKHTVLAKGAGGGVVHGPGTGTSDSIPAWLSNGEFVMKNAAVRTYGAGFMHALNNMQVAPPKYAFGGMVGTVSPSIARFAEGGPVSGGHSVLNLHIGDHEFKGLKAPEAVASQLRRFAINQQTTSTGRKPSWVN